MNHRCIWIRIGLCGMFVCFKNRIHIQKKIYKKIVTPFFFIARDLTHWWTDERIVYIVFFFQNGDIFPDKRDGSYCLNSSFCPRKISILSDHPRKLMICGENISILLGLMSIEIWQWKNTISDNWRISKLVTLTMILWKCLSLFYLNLLCKWGVYFRYKKYNLKMFAVENGCHT